MRRDSGEEGCRKGGMQKRRDAEKEGCRKGGIQERRDAGQEEAQKERSRKGRIQDRWEREWLMGGGEGTASGSLSTPSSR